jgi:hypothetical protein
MMMSVEGVWWMFCDDVVCMLKTAGRERWLRVNMAGNFDDK